MVHGLAASIRASEESETFDLGGQNVTTITNTIRSAFQEPFALEDMIRITFVVGAGKQARQKYDDGAAKAVTSELRRCGYHEDQGASCVMECAGSYKMQHDTGKNLKTIVVFPKVALGEVDGDSAAEEAEPLIPENSPGYKIAISSMNVFKNMLSSQCPSWSQKKGCLGSIEALKEMLQGLESKLMKGIPLDGPEQSFYDAVAELDEKEAHVRNELHDQVERGVITKFEQDLLLEHNSERIATLKNEKKSTAKALQRKELLEQIEPVTPHQLRHEVEIRKLRKELLPLLQMEESTRGRLLSVQETQTLARKDEIQEEIEYLEEASRGWFEDDAAFESRVQASRKVFENKKAKKAAKSVAIGSGTMVRTSASKWVLPGATGRTKATTKKKGKLKGAGVFSAMMMDSDDEDSNDDDESSTKENDGIKKDEHGSDDAHVEKVDASTSAFEKKTSKKKKKRRKKKQNQVDSSAEEAPTHQDSTEEAAANRESAEREEEETALVQTIDFIKTHIVPLLVSFLTWLVALVFGKPKKRGGQRR